MDIEAIVQWSSYLAHWLDIPRQVLRYWINEGKRHD